MFRAYTSCGTAKVAQRELKKLFLPDNRVKLKGRGATNLRYLCLLAAPEGIERFTRAHPDVPVFTAAIDDHLNEKGYIVPGLGDAGDRMYGTK